MRQDSASNRTSTLTQALSRQREDWKRGRPRHHCEAIIYKQLTRRGASLSAATTARVRGNDDSDDDGNDNDDGNDRRRLPLLELRLLGWLRMGD